jgi:DNA-binding HxlR family transcriptional regulator
MSRQKSEDDPVYRADCPSRVILDQIADKWSMMALAVLHEPRRFNAIKRRLDGVTQRVLTQTLRKLERNGMLTRRVLDGRVLGVEYALTPLGRSLQGPFSTLFDWTVENMNMIESCQKAYDEREDQIAIRRGPPEGQRPV